MRMYKMLQEYREEGSAHSPRELSVCAELGLKRKVNIFIDEKEGLPRSKHGSGVHRAPGLWKSTAACLEVGEWWRG